jgi:sugar lactone lactonase YvrE
VLAVTGGFLTLDTGTGATAPLADVDHGRAGLRMNDGACYRAGRFYAGSMAADESPGAGALYRLDPDHRLARLMSGIGISNSIGWSPGDRQMCYVDSLDHRLDVLDYDAATGEVSGRRPVAEIGGGRAVHRYSPAGALTTTVELPAAYVTCPAFGGPDLETMYITTAAGPGDGAGGLFAFRPGVTGLPTNPYRG